MNREIFIDSGAFIAFLVRRDRMHAEAVRLFSRPPPRWCTSVLVIAETYSWFLHGLGQAEARTFQQLLEKLTTLDVLDTTAHHRAAVWKKLAALRGIKLTFVDASSLVWLEERKVSTVWGTDQHLAVEGATVIPGPPPRKSVSS